MALQSIDDPKVYPPSHEPEHATAGGLHVSSVTTWLIVVNVVVYVADLLFLRMGIGRIIGTPWGMYVFGPLEWWGHFSTLTAIEHGQVWRFITFQFLHANWLHLLMNMMSLFFFGPMIEEYLGRGRFLAFYLVCGIGGAASYLLLWTLGWLVPLAWIPLVGASAGIFGILMAAAILAPDATVVPVFPPIPMRLKMVAWALLGVAVWTIMTQGRNAGGEAAHLGGAVIGYILISRPWRLVLPAHRRQRRIGDEQPGHQWLA